jgi:hypothetical protein
VQTVDLVLEYPRVPSGCFNDTRLPTMVEALDAYILRSWNKGSIAWKT